MLEESSVGGIPCWEESRVIKVNAKAKKYESLGGILLESVTKKKKNSQVCTCTFQFFLNWDT